VIVIYLLNIVSFLWLNVIGCLLVMILAWLYQQGERMNGAIRK